MKKQFIDFTVGMQRILPNGSSKLVKAEFSRITDGILIEAVSGHNLEPFKSIKKVIVSEDEFNNRDYDYYDSQVEYFWAMNLLGL